MSVAFEREPPVLLPPVVIPEEYDDTPPAAKLDRLPRRADLVTGGSRLARPGFFHEPTVVAGVHQGDEIVQEEIFGPVVTVQPFADELRPDPRPLVRR